MIGRQNIIVMIGPGCGDGSHVVSVRFGQKLLAARNRAGLTQAGLAKRMGLASGSSISQWERGKVHPEKSSVSALISALRCPPEDLIDDIGTPYDDLLAPPQAPSQERLLLSDEETGLVTTWRALAPVYKAALLETLLPAFMVASTHKRRRSPPPAAH